MPAKRTFEYDYETINKLSDWTDNRLAQDVTRRDVDIESLASVAVWLAANGKPWLRAEMFKRLAPDALGISKRSPESNQKLELSLGTELLRLVFEQAVAPRKKTGKRRGKRVTS